MRTSKHDAVCARLYKRLYPRSHGRFRHWAIRIAPFDKQDQLVCNCFDDLHGAGNTSGRLAVKSSVERSASGEHSNHAGLRSQRGWFYGRLHPDERHIWPIFAQNVDRRRRCRVARHNHDLAASLYQFCRYRPRTLHYLGRRPVAIRTVRRIRNINGAFIRAKPSERIEDALAPDSAIEEPDQRRCLHREDQSPNFAARSFASGWCHESSLILRPSFMATTSMPFFCQWRRSTLATSRK